MIKRVFFLLVSPVLLTVVVNADWLQFQGDARRSGNLPEVVLTDSLALAAAIPLTDAI